MFLTLITYLGDGLMYFIALGAVIVLFASLIGLAIWIPMLVWHGLSRMLP